MINATDPSRNANVVKVGQFIERQRVMYFSARRFLDAGDVISPSLASVVGSAVTSISFEHHKEGMHTNTRGKGWKQKLNLESRVILLRCRGPNIRTVSLL